MLPERVGEVAGRALGLVVEHVAGDAQLLLARSRAASAAPSTTSARAALISIVRGRMRPSAASPMSPRVSGASATCSVTASARPHSSGTVRMRSTPSSAARASSSERDHATTCMPNARARRMTSCPIDPGADDAERAPVEAVGLAVLLLVPRARAQLAHLIGDAPIERQQQRHRQLGDGDSVLARTVGDVDAVGRGRLDVDGVDAGAGAYDQRQRRGARDRRALHFLAARDDDAGVRDRLRQRLGGEVGLVGDGEPERAKGVEVRFGEGVDDENLHACSRYQLTTDLARSKSSTVSISRQPPSMNAGRMTSPLVDEVVQ